MTESTGVIYFNHGTSHCARLMVALHSLRKHYSGEVTIMDSGQSNGIVDKLAEAFQCNRMHIPMIYKRKNSCYVTKSTIPLYSPYHRTIMLDSDTIVMMPIDELFERLRHPGEPGIILTQFADWVSTGKIVGGRISHWTNVDNVPALEGIATTRWMVDQCLSHSFPAINTGVLAFRRGDPFLEAWPQLTLAGWRNFICDEIAAQLLSVVMPRSVLHDVWNWSPIYSSGVDPVRIVHCHGKKHVTSGSGRGEQGHAIWWPGFVKCWRENAANCREWLPAGDDRLQWAITHCAADLLPAA